MRMLDYSEERKKVEEILANRGFEVEIEKEALVKDIIMEIRNNGDQALYKYTSRFDRVDLEDLRVTEREIEAAYDKIEDDFLVSIKKAIENIKKFHYQQLRENWFSYQDEKGEKMVGQLINPLQRIGVYVPGGRAAYPSSVLMTVIPAKVAGVKEVVVVNPPGKDGKLNPYTLVAASEAGVDEIYKVGGAQAIAGLAYGTETIKKVDKIVGPGNIYVTLAKKNVFGLVDIDMLAGPSEVLILTDETGKPAYLAADLLSQAEHDPLAVPIMVTTSESIAEKTKEEVEKQLLKLSREEDARRAWEEQGLIIVVNNLKDGIEVVNNFAPEHFELVVKKPLSYLGQIKNAGAIFVGEYSSEPLGDYMAGPNHVLPTGGTARFASPLNTDDFVKKSSLIYYQKQGLKDVEGDIRKLAGLEGLDAHAAAIKARFSEGED